MMAIRVISLFILLCGVISRNCRAASAVSYCYVTGECWIFGGCCCGTASYALVGASPTASSTYCFITITDYIQRYQSVMYRASAAQAPVAYQANCQTFCDNWWLFGLSSGYSPWWGKCYDGGDNLNDIVVASQQYNPVPPITHRMLNSTECYPVNCGSSLGNRAYANGAPTFPTERSTTQLVCNTGYVWSTGETGTTAKTATCNDIGNGYGSWITNGDCVVNCSTGSVPTNQLLVASTTYSTLQNAVAGMTCANSNYTWASGSAWNTMKYFTCTNQGGSGIWAGTDYCLQTCVNPPDQNLIFYGYANQSIYIGFTVSMTCASGYDWNNGVSGNTPMLANCTVSSGQAVWTTVWSCTPTSVTITGLQIATLVISSLAIAGVVVAIVLQVIIFLKM